MQVEVKVSYPKRKINDFSFIRISGFLIWSVNAVYLTSEIGSIQPYMLVSAEFIAVLVNQTAVILLNVAI